MKEEQRITLPACLPALLYLSSYLPWVSTHLLIPLVVIRGRMSFVGSLVEWFDTGLNTLFFESSRLREPCSIDIKTYLVSVVDNRLLCRIIPFYKC
ncbi:hypothetical protein F5B17DRAFT_249750 [Nemania serpens]|nr:hypothetical protein F5B17DRAFT_249750 [Nemania serpens]